MTRYFFQRVMFMLMTLFVIAAATFFLMKLLPGTPLRNSEKLTPEQRDIILDKYHLKDSIPVQFGYYVSDLVKGDLGVSFQYDNREVTDLIKDRIGPSAQLGFQAIILGTFLGILLGLAAAVKHNSWLDYSTTILSVIGISIPSFVVAALLQYYVGVKLQWLPVAYWESFKYTILPTIALAFGVIGVIARFMRAEMLEVLQSEYMLTAKAKGVSPAGVIFKHALRNALIPVITILGPMTVGLMTGTLVIERIFAVPGLGDQFVNSITTNDYSIIMGTTIFYSALLVFVIFIVDILYGIIDPRIRLSGSGGSH